MVSGLRGMPQAAVGGQWSFESLSSNWPVLFLSVFECF